MLVRLKIDNIAIIESADIDFAGGFNVLTGETGAGKSIIIDSINAVTGERTSKELIRTGCEKGSVTAVFESVGKKVQDKLESMGIESDDTVILSRVIKADGRSVCTVNSTPVSVSALKSVGTLLINIHGQHDSQALLQSENHCSYIDLFGSFEDLKELYYNSFNELNDIAAQIKRLDMDVQEKARRVDMLTFQIDELERAQITIGEIESLNDTKRFLKSAKDVIEALNTAYEYLSRDSAGCDSVASAAYNADLAAENFTQAACVAQRLNDVKYELEDCQNELRELINQAECDPDELERVEERLDLLHRLSSKYGSTEQEMLMFLDNAKKELSTLVISDEQLSALKKQHSEALDKTKALAQQLTQKRLNYGQRLSQRICSELEFLNMPNITFTVDRKEKPLSPDGCDEIEFLISANAGENPKPLSKIASGGELSRIMLAIKNVLSDKDGTQTMIFDEIDTGVSGYAARRIAEKLREVSGGKQVVCVTHLAQIASFAHCHMKISKHVDSGKTYTTVESLSYDGRAQELARIMGSGAGSEELFIAGAKELLASAGIFD